MDFKEIIEEEKKYYRQDFSRLNEVLNKVRDDLSGKSEFSLEGVNLDGIIDYKEYQYVFITLCQAETQSIRFGSRKETLEESIKAVINHLKAKTTFRKFDVSNPDKVRIKLEWIYKRVKIENPKNLHLTRPFNHTRFEPGINGLSVSVGGKTHFWLPTELPGTNQEILAPMFARLAQKMGLVTDKKLNVEERAKLFLENREGAEYRILFSKAFVTYKNETIPLYRGNVVYDEFSYDTLITMYKAAMERMLSDMKEDGRFLYFYNPVTDDCIDNEHPNLPSDSYYCEVRHSGGGVALAKMYEFSKDERYSAALKKAIQWSIQNNLTHTDNKGRECLYIMYNGASRLGAIALTLLMALEYRKSSGDKTFDKEIEGWVRHILTRISDDGEILQYYVHRNVNGGKPAPTLTEKEKDDTYNFFFPGETLLALGVFINTYDLAEDLREEAIDYCKKAIRWIIDIRPIKYKEKFAPLSLDSWYIQAVEELIKTGREIIQPEDIEYAFSCADSFVNQMYGETDSPYMDYEGGLYGAYGHSYSPNPGRYEGLIAAYYLAKYLKNDRLKTKYLTASKKAAKCCFNFFIAEEDTYYCIKPEKAVGGIKLKSTRPTLRVDYTQHLVNFLIRLYLTENKSNIANKKGQK